MKEKKVVIVTGASRGIGLAASRLFCEKGCTVYALSRSAGDTAGVKSVVCDVTDSAKLKEVIDGIFDAEKRIDILINNAGAGISGAVEKTTLEDVKALFDLNFFAMFEAVKYTAPYMRRQGGGKIINTGSVAGMIHIPFQAFYSATKAAVEALSNCLRGELAPFNIKVATVMPGDTRTNFTDARKKDFEKDDPDYGSRISHSIEIMEKDERGGMPPEKTAKVIYKAASSVSPKPLYTVGFMYKAVLVLDRLLPKRPVQYIINSIYG